MTATVLLIEDNDQNAYLVKVLLEPHGYLVVHVADGPSGLEWVRTRKADLILLDIQLPTMNGYKVARLLRQMDSLRDTPIIAITSYAMLGDREKALESGCTGYLEKPIEPETFVIEIERFLSPSPSTQESL